MHSDIFEKKIKYNFKEVGCKPSEEALYQHQQNVAVKSTATSGAAAASPPAGASEGGFYLLNKTQEEETKRLKDALANASKQIESITSLQKIVTNVLSQKAPQSTKHQNFRKRSGALRVPLRTPPYIFKYFSTAPPPNQGMHPAILYTSIVGSFFLGFVIAFFI